MKCTDESCDGKINVSQSVSLQTGCHSGTIVFPCNICGFLHKLSGDEVHKIPIGMARRSGERVFLKNGKIEHEEM